MLKEEYYTEPSDEIFDEIKNKSIDIWKTYSDIGGYSSGKIARVSNITNVQDNAYYIIAMFDEFNQRKLYDSVSREAKEYMDKVKEEY